MMTNGQKLARLAALAGEAGHNYYERTMLAVQLMDDRDWVHSQFKGDHGEAAERLEEDYFHDLSGSITIYDLLIVGRKFPNEEDWKNRKYRLRVLLADTKPPATPRTYERVKKVEFDAVVEQTESLKAELRHKNKVIKGAEDTIADLESTVAGLEKEVTRLTRENDRLRGRVEELERLVGKKFGVEVG